MKPLLEPNVYQRSRRTDGIVPGRRRYDVPVLGAWIVLALALLVAGRLQMPFVERLRMALEDAASGTLRSVVATTTPLFTLGHDIADLRTLAEDRKRLADENERLKGWQTRAQALERQTAELTALARVVTAQPVEFVTARVVAGGSGPFARLALIDAGRDQGVTAGFPAVGAHGLVGRVVEAGRQTARLLLMTDITSRIPVAVGAGATRAIMEGDNSALPKIAYLHPEDRIKPGDDVVTSGVGGVFPPGLRVGTVVDTGEVLRIEPAERLDRLDYVSVLQFASRSAVLVEEERAGGPGAVLADRLKSSLGEPASKGGR